MADQSSGIEVDLKAQLRRRRSSLVISLISAFAALILLLLTVGYVDSSVAGAIACFILFLATGLIALWKSMAFSESDTIIRYELKRRGSDLEPRDLYGPSRDLDNIS